MENEFTSGWNHPHHSCVFPRPIALQHCLLRPQGLGERIHHRDGSPRRSMRASVLPLGAILGPGAVPSMEVSERTNNDRLMLAVRRDVYFLLVSASGFSYSLSKYMRTNIAFQTSTWNSYFGSYLQVVNRLDITTANYVLNAFSLTSYIFSPIFGL